MKTVMLLLLPLFLYAQTVKTFQSDNMEIKVEKLASNLGVPWGMTFVAPEKLLIALKKGSFVLLNTKHKDLTSVTLPLKVWVSGQGGLLDVQTSPNFENNHTLYFTYVKNVDNQGATTLAKASWLNNSLHHVKDLLVTQSTTNTTRHFGSRITFDESGHVYFGVGDRGARPNGQDLSTHAGSIMRLNLDGTVPKDNPFVNQKNSLPAIYSYGHRNPQGLFYDTVSKQLFSGEHGPRGGDEINIIKKGANYGWPVISYGREYWNPLPVGEGTHKKGMEQPIKFYVPSIAAGSLMVYQGEEFPSWKGNIFQGALKLTHLNRIVLDKKNNVLKEERLLENLQERIRNVIQDKQGRLFLSTDSGNIYQLSSK